MTCILLNYFVIWLLTLDIITTEAVSSSSTTWIDATTVTTVMPIQMSSSTSHTTPLATNAATSPTKEIPTPFAGDQTIPTEGTSNSCSGDANISTLGTATPFMGNGTITKDGSPTTFGERASIESTKSTLLPTRPVFHTVTIPRALEIQTHRHTHQTHQSDIGSALAPPVFLIADRVGNTQDEINLDHASQNGAPFDEYRIELYGNVRYVFSTYKYTMPIVIGMLIIPTAGFICMTCKQMRTATAMNNASCSLLLAIGMADFLSIITGVLEYWYMYSSSRPNHGYLPYTTCSVMSVLERFSAIPHTASNWLTVVLSVQRYLCVGRPFLAKSHFTVRKSIIIISLTYTIAVIMHLCRFVDVHFVRVSFHISSSNNLTDTVETCYIRYSSWIKQPVLYEVLFSWFRVIIVQLFPCLLLIVFTLRLVRALRVSRKSLEKLNIVDSKRQKQRRLLSIFVIVASGIVFVIEVSMGTVLCLNSIRISTGVDFVSYRTIKLALIGIDIAVYVSYFCIFSMYCLMSQDFRQTVVNVFKLILIQIKCVSLQKKTTFGNEPSSKSSGDTRNRTDTLPQTETTKQVSNSV